MNENKYMMMIIILTIYPFPELHRLLACFRSETIREKKKKKEEILRVSGSLCM